MCVGVRLYVYVYVFVQAEVESWGWGQWSSQFTKLSFVMFHFGEAALTLQPNWKQIGLTFFSQWIHEYSNIFKHVIYT